MKRALFLLLALAVPAWGGDLRITGEAKVSPYKLVRLKAENVTGQNPAILWDVYPEDAVDAIEEGGKLSFVAPPGTYKIKLRTIAGNGVVETARLTVTIGGDVPPGPNPPGPTPPGPKSAKAYIITVSETEVRTVEQARVLADLAFWQQWDSSSWGWTFGQQPHYQHFDPTTHAAYLSQQGYVAAASKRGVAAPFVIALDEKGVVLDVKPLPTTQAAMKDFIAGVSK